GCVFLARNYTPRGSKGEIDLVGYDDKRWHLRNSGRAPSGRTCRPDLSVTREKQYVVVRTAQRFLEERHVGECSCRFDEMAIDNCPGQPPVVRLHKDAYSPQIQRPDRNIFTGLPEAVQSKVSWLLTPRG